MGDDQAFQRGEMLTVVVELFFAETINRVYIFNIHFFRTAFRYVSL